MDALTPSAHAVRLYTPTDLPLVSISCGRVKLEDQERLQSDSGFATCREQRSIGEPRFVACPDPRMRITGVRWDSALTRLSRVRVSRAFLFPDHCGPGCIGWVACRLLLTREWWWSWIQSFYWAVDHSVGGVSRKILTWSNFFPWCQNRRPGYSCAGISNDFNPLAKTSRNNAQSTSSPTQALYAPKR